MMMMMMKMIMIKNNNNNKTFSLLTAPQTISDKYAQVTRVQSCPNHVQHIERFSRAN